MPQPSSDTVTDNVEPVSTTTDTFFAPASKELQTSSSTSCPTEVTIVELRSKPRRSGGSCLNEHDFDRGSVVPPLMPPVGYVRISALRVPSGATDAGKMSRALLCASGKIPEKHEPQMEN